MMCGLLGKIVRETGVTTMLFVVGLGLATGLITLVLPQLQEGFNDFMLQVPFVRTLVSGIMGVDVEGGLSARMMLSVAWSHPVVLSGVWAHLIVVGSRVPAGEIDRGTIEILLGWPVSRRRLCAAETVGLVTGGAMVIGGLLLGYFIAATRIDAGQRPPVGHVMLVAVNLGALSIAVGGITMLFSSLADRRGRVIGGVFGLLVASFLLNFVAQFWAPAQAVDWLSLMDYYQPGQIILSGRVPVSHLLVLLGAGGLAWLAAVEVTARRDLAAP